MINRMTLAASTLTLRNTEDQKLIYLYVLDNPHVPYIKARRQLRFETAERFYTNTRRLAEFNLIHPHPFLLSDDVTKYEIRRAGGLSLRVIDESLTTLLWALSPNLTNPHTTGLTEDEARQALRLMAQEEKQQVDFWQGGNQESWHRGLRSWII